MSRDVEAAVISAIVTVLRDTGRSTVAVEPAMRLAADVGLDSLDLAQTIVLLERSIGVDPFRAEEMGRPVIRTVGDLVAIYTDAMSRG